MHEDGLAAFTGPARRVRPVEALGWLLDVPVPGGEGGPLARKPPLAATWTEMIWVTGQRWSSILPRPEPT